MVLGRADATPTTARAHGLLAAVCLATLGACAASPPRPLAPPAPIANVAATPQFVTNKTDGTLAELRHRADDALLRLDFRAAVEPLEALRVFEPSARNLFDLGLARELSSDRAQAEATFAEVRAQHPGSNEARQALFRLANLAAYTENWTTLLQLSEQILALQPSDEIARMTGLGGRAVARIETGDDVRAMHDAQDGLDLMEAAHYGTGGRLPVAAAQLRFALAEVRRVRSERIRLDTVQTEAFIGTFEVRCAMLLDAQSAFTDAIRSEDPRWAAMSGYKVGEMYRTLHRDLMAIPPTKGANTKDKKQLFFAMMHVRYRVLLEKGSDMMIRTVALGEKLNDASGWLEKARATKADIDKALSDERATIAALPYTEAEVQKALDILKKKVLDAQEAAEKRAAKNAH
jgi:tetratricopeptide (TPR) repeat protein